MAEYFSDKQITQFKDIFDNFDKNSDGDLTADELKYVMKSLGQKVKMKYCKNMIQKVCALIFFIHYRIVGFTLTSRYQLLYKAVA